MYEQRVHKCPYNTINYSKFQQKWISSKFYVYMNALKMINEQILIFTFNFFALIKFPKYTCFCLSYCLTCTRKNVKNKQC